MCKQVFVIRSTDPEEFQKALNDKLRELENCDPSIEFNNGAGYCAYIIYSDNDDLFGRVNSIGHYLCDSCMKCKEAPHPRVKWRKCLIFGTVHGKTECEHYMEGVS